MRFAFFAGQAATGGTSAAIAVLGGHLRAAREIRGYTFVVRYVAAILWPASLGPDDARCLVAMQGGAGESRAGGDAGEGGQEGSEDADEEYECPMCTFMKASAVLRKSCSDHCSLQSLVRKTSPRSPGLVPRRGGSAKRSF